MLYVALAEAVVLVVVIATFGNLLRIQARQHSRDRALLLNQLLHLAGRPWQEAPAEQSREDEAEARALTLALPEQHHLDW